MEVAWLGGSCIPPHARTSLVALSWMPDHTVSRHR
jgi:hypothetical protein